jgi:hypothetical protein
MRKWTYSSDILVLDTRVSGELHSSADLTPSTHWIEAWVSHRSGLDAVEKRKVSFYSRELNPAV